MKIGRLQNVEMRLEDIDMATVTAISVLKTNYSDSAITISLRFSYKESVGAFPNLSQLFPASPQKSPTAL
jgi:hypothetical protein